MTEYNRDRWLEEAVEVSIEKVEKYGEEGQDNTFFTELRVVTGAQKGQLKRHLWFRKKRDGNPRKDTSNLLMGLTGNPQAASYELVNKQFKTTPWYPENSDFPIFTRIELTGEVDPFADAPPADPTPAEDATPW